jgi:hypothetical protein
MEYYNSHIQLDKDVIADVFTEIKEHTKMLVFGLGYDSTMWYKGNHSNTFFVEHNDTYIEMNKKDIPATNIIKYTYHTTCASSIPLTKEQISTFIIPEKIMKEAPFDIIIIDGPEGYSLEKPGRLIPCYWSTLLSKPGTVIYIDDANRTLEAYCIERYFKPYKKKEFNKRDKCVKVYM